MGKYQLSHLEELEAESIFILREVAAQFENPVLLFSGGKDSIVCYHLARKAFYPASVPFPLMHVDTGHNFDELYAFRDSLMEETKGRLVIASVQKSIDEGKVVEEKGIYASRNKLQTTTLLMVLKNINLIVQLEELVEMRKRQERKSDFSLTETTLDNGTLKIKGLNYGIYSMGKSILESILGFFLLVIGQRWIFGNIF